MITRKLAARLAQAGAIAGMLAGLTGGAWGIGGTIGGTYQDQVNLSTNKKDVLLKFKLLGQPLVVDTVTCQIQSPSTPPFEVSLSQSNAAGVLIFIPVTFIGQTGSKNVYTANVTNLGYGISKNFRPEILVRWVENGSYDVICSLVGKQ